MTKLKVIATAAATLGILAAGAGLLAQQATVGRAGGQAGESALPAANAAPPLDPARKALIEARVATARQVFELDLQRYQNLGTIDPEETSVWSRRWAEEQLRLGPPPAERLAAIRDHLERVRALEQIADRYAKAGQGRVADALRAKYFRLEAEQMLADARAAYPGVPLPPPKPAGKTQSPASPPPPPPAK